MSNSSKGKVKKKSVFQEKLDKGAKKAYDKSLPEDKRKEQRYKKLETIFTSLGNKENRYLFYCPDFTQASTINKVIYEYVNELTTLGYTAYVVHEVKGYKADFLEKELTKDVKVLYLSEKKEGKITAPSLKFEPTDTIIIPDAFWTVMSGFFDIKTIHKVVLCFGYNGLAACEPGADWGFLGFNDVICLSEKLKEDYKALWPHLNYYVIGYKLKQIEPIAETLKQPVVAISCRNRDDAQSIINVFYSKYPFMDIFRFDVLKKKTQEEYYESLQHSAITLFVDPSAGFPPIPVESLANNTPVLAVYGRGMEHLVETKGITWLEGNDPYVIAEALFSLCLSWLNDNTIDCDKELIKQFNSIEINLVNTFKELQNHKIKTFSAIKNAVDEGVLDDNVFNDKETVGMVEPKLEIVKD